MTRTHARRHAIPALAAAPALALAGWALAGDLPYKGEGYVMATPDQLEWKSVASMEAPAEIAILEGDLSTEEPFTMRLRMPAHYEIRPHIHPAYERVTVLDGTFHFAHGTNFGREATTELPEGSFAVMAPGEPMFGYTSEETVIQLHGTGPWGIEYLDPADDPRS